MNLLKNFFRKDPEKAIPFAFDAEILRRENKYENALKSINKAINANNNNPDYYMQRALILRDLKEFSNALKDIDKAIKINPEYNRYYMYRYLIHKDLNDINSADKDLELMNKNKYDNNLDTLYEYLGKEARDKGKGQEAIFYFKKALEYNPNNGRIANELSDLERNR